MNSKYTRQISKKTDGHDYAQICSKIISVHAIQTKNKLWKCPIYYNISVQYELRKGAGVEVVCAYEYTRQDTLRYLFLVANTHKRAKFIC